MKRVLVSDPLPREGLAILERTPGIELDLRSGLKGPALRDALANADGVIIRSGTTLTGELLTGLPRLKVVVRAGVGVDNIDVEAATREGIVVMNTPGGNTYSTAEHTIALMLTMCRRIVPADCSLRAHRWDRNQYVGTQLAGKTLGVVGLGRVGLAVAKRALAFEMKVLGFDPFLTPERARELGVEAVDKLDQLYDQVDILSVHVPLSDETRSLIGERELALLRPGSYVINCARGGIVDEDALAAALRSGHLKGAALDVFATEPCTESPLFDLPNLVVTPHLGASTAEAQMSVAIEAAQLMAAFLTSGNVRFSVNMASIEPAELEDVRRYLDLAHRLGRLQAQMARGPIQSAAVQYRGDVTQKKTKLITASFAVGLLEGALEQEVNLVNAMVLAAERGILIEESMSSEKSDFSTLIRTEVTPRGGDAFVASGTTRGATYNRLVQLGPYRLDAFIEGTMLVYIHEDKPGLIGYVGTVLGEHEVNIAQMTVGRKQPGGTAIGVLALDQAPSPEALEKIRRYPHIRSVDVIRLPAFGEMPRSFG